MTDKYAKGGFDKRTAWILDFLDVKNVDVHRMQINCNGFQIVGADCVDEQAVVEFDKRVTHGVDRSRLLRHFCLKRTDCITKIALNKASNEVVGFAVARVALNNGRIIVGPCYAASNEIFKALFSELVISVQQTYGEGTVFTFRSPSIVSDRLIELMAGVADVNNKEHCTPQFTQAIPQFEHQLVYSLLDVILFF